MANFNRLTFKNKKTVYVPNPKNTGIYSIWDWNEAQQSYKKRETGIKYYAIKRIKGHVRRHQQISKCFETLEEARAWRISSEVLFVPKRNQTFEEVLEGYLAHISTRIRKTTLESYARYKKQLSYFLKINVSDINSFMVDEWLRVRKSPAVRTGLKASRLSFEKEIEFLSRVLKYYCEYVDESFVNPVKARHKKDSILDMELYLQAKAEAKTKFLTQLEAQTFLRTLADEAKLDPNKWVFYHVALFQMRTGARIGETCALKWEDLNLNLGLVVVQKTVQWFRTKGVPPAIGKVPKNGHYRTLELTQAHLLELKGLHASSPRNRAEDLVFSQSDGQLLTYRQIQFAYDNAFKKIGSKFRSTHILRHSFATSYLEITNDIHSLKVIMGHSKISQTEVYAKVTDVKMKHSLGLYDSKMTSVLDSSFEVPNWKFLTPAAEA